MLTPGFSPIRWDAAHPVVPPVPLHRRLLPIAAGPRLKVLLVLSSRPLDLGEDPGLFELTARLAERVAFSIAIDDGDFDNLDLVRAFAARHAIPVEVGPASSLAALVRRSADDLVETFAWVDPAVNAQVLDGVGDRALIYSGNHRPAAILEVMPGAAEIAADVHHRMIHRADAVLCSTAADREVIQQYVAPGRNHCHFLAPTPGELAADCPAGRQPSPVDRDAQAVAKWQLLAGTWFTRHYLDRPFQGPRPAAPSPT